MGKIISVLKNGQQHVNVENEAVLFNCDLYHCIIMATALLLCQIDSSAGASLLEGFVT